MRVDRVCLAASQSDGFRQSFSGSGKSSLIVWESRVQDFGRSQCYWGPTWSAVLERMAAGQISL